jgi:hypothetical protein
VDCTVMIAGFRVCTSCFRASVGICVSTMRAKIAAGAIGSAPHDARKNVTSGYHKRQMIAVRELMALVERGDGQPLPGSQGGLKAQFLQFPQSSLKELLEIVNRRLNPQNQSLKDQSTDPAAAAAAAAAASIPINISRSTLKRAIEIIEATLAIKISVAKSKEFMQCSICKTIKNKRRAASVAGQVKLTIEKENHLNQVAAQRADFGEVRDLAK